MVKIPLKNENKIVLYKKLEYCFWETPYVSTLYLVLTFFFFSFPHACSEAIENVGNIALKSPPG